MASSSEWCVDHGNKIHGPFSSSQLKQLASSGKIKEDTKLRLGAESKWSSAKNVKRLFPSRELAPVKAAVVENAAPLQAVVVPNTPIAVRLPCPFCGEEISQSAIKCRHCNEFLDGRPKHQPTPPQQVYVAPAVASQSVTNVTVVNQVGMARTKRWNRFVAGLLSFIIPGLGQLYKGQAINAVAWFVLTAAGYFAFLIPGFILHFCCVIGALMGDPYK